MKKLLVLLLATMITASLAACGKEDVNNGSEEPVGSESVSESEEAESAENTEDGENAGAGTEISGATDVLSAVWAEYKASVSEDLQFPAAGGNVETMVMDEPGTFDTTIEYAQDTLTASYCATPEFVAMTDDISTLMNMMMANNFTAATYHIAEAGNVDSAIDNLKEATINNQWMCGMPEKLIIVTIGEDYILSAFGNAQVIDAFATAVTTVYGEEAVFAVEESLLQ